MNIALRIVAGWFTLAFAKWFGFHFMNQSITIVNPLRVEIQKEINAAILYPSDIRSNHAFSLLGHEGILVSLNGQNSKDVS